MKQTIPYDQYRKIVTEAEAVAQLVQSAGWKVLEDDLLTQAGRIEELLAQNRLHTVQETITTPQGTKTFVTTAESQIAEHAGRYQQIQSVFDTVHTIIEAPQKLQRLEAEGTLTVQKAEDQDAAPRPSPTKRLSKQMKQLRDVIQHLVQKGGTV